MNQTNITDYIDKQIAESGGRSGEMITIDDARDIALAAALYATSGRPRDPGAEHWKQLAADAQAAGSRKHERLIELQSVVRRCASTFRELDEGPKIAAMISTPLYAEMARLCETVLPEVALHADQSPVGPLQAYVGGKPVGPAIQLSRPLIPEEQAQFDAFLNFWVSVSKMRMMFHAE